jgi:hypothetical protein
LLVLSTHPIWVLPPLMHPPPSAKERATAIIKATAGQSTILRLRLHKFTHVLLALSFGNSFLQLVFALFLLVWTPWANGFLGKTFCYYMPIKVRQPGEHTSFFFPTLVLKFVFLYGHFTSAGT